MADDNPGEERLWETLRKLEFLRCVEDEHVKELAKLGHVVEFPAGIIVFAEGQPASNCYLIIDGTVLLEMCGPGGCTRILTIGEGEVLGWSSVLGKAQLTAAARTITATKAIELNGSEVLALCERIPSLGFQLMRCMALALAKRLTATRLQLLDLYDDVRETSGERQ